MVYCGGGTGGSGCEASEDAVTPDAGCGGGGCCTGDNGGRDVAVGPVGPRRGGGGATWLEIDGFGGVG